MTNILAFISRRDLFVWIKSTVEQLMYPSSSTEDRVSISQHIAQMESAKQEYETKCEIQKGAGGNAMRLVITIAPRGNQS